MTPHVNIIIFGLLGLGTAFLLYGPQDVLSMITFAIVGAAVSFPVSKLTPTKNSPR